MLEAKPRRSAGYMNSTTAYPSNSHFPRLPRSFQTIQPLTPHPTQLPNPQRLSSGSSPLLWVFEAWIIPTPHLVAGAELPKWVCHLLGFPANFHLFGIMDFIHKIFFPVKNASFVVKICDCEGLKTEPCCKSPSEYELSPLAPPPASNGSGLSTTVVVIIAVLCSLFLISSYYVVLAKFCVFWRRWRAPPAREGSEGEGEGEEDEDEIVDNPVNYVWYINTVGLEQSVINAITMCKYKKGDGLIEGTECSVCLSEFQDDEDLRLLPKCSHAFHVACIDTWLRSHVNCPFCRARIVSNPANGSTSSQIPHESDNPVGVPRENVQSIDRLYEQLDGQNFVGELPSEVEREDGRLMDAEAFDGALVPGTDSRISVHSDLRDSLSTGEYVFEISGDGVQPVRRSVSMDSSAASKLHMSLAGELLLEQDREKKVSLGECSRLKRLGSSTKYGHNNSFAKIVGNGGKGSPFVSRLVAMKRSRSSCGNFFSSRHGRNRNSMLPL